MLGRRITPACAGKTKEVHKMQETEKDHPRVCGENYFARVARGEEAGSPPRVRGKRACCDVALSVFRITPACAGKTRAAGRHGRQIRDHPRVCGENLGGAISI